MYLLNCHCLLNMHIEETKVLSLLSRRRQDNFTVRISYPFLVYLVTSKPTTLTSYCATGQILCISKEGQLG